MPFQTRGLEFIQCYSNSKLIQDLAYAFNNGVIDRVTRVDGEEIRPWLESVACSFRWHPDQQATQETITV